MRTKIMVLVTTALTFVGIPGGLVLFQGSALAIDAPPLVTVREAPGSVAYLESQYGISEREALRRLDLQRMDAELDRSLASRYPDTFAGTSLNQKDGGLLI